MAISVAASKFENVSELMDGTIYITIHVYWIIAVSKFDRKKKYV